MHATYTGPLTEHPGSEPEHFPTIHDLYTPHPFQSVAGDVLIFTGRTRLGWIMIEDIPTTLSMIVYDGVDATGVNKLTLDEFYPRGVLRLALDMQTGIFIDHVGTGTIKFGIAYVGA